MTAHLDCQRCGARRHIIFDFIAHAVRYWCPRGCDGNGVRDA